MPGFILHVGASMICPHGGQVSVISSNTRVTVNGQQIVTATDNFMIAGCIFNISGAPHPCIITKWIVSSTRVFINGQPTILNNSVGLCQSADQSVQGPPNIIASQLRVRGT